MLDIKRIRVNTEQVKEAMKVRGEAFDLGMIDKAAALDERRREIISEVEALKNKRNTASLEIPKL
jgi:seryl-tRNA synthetase